MQAQLHRARSRRCGVNGGRPVLVAPAAVRMFDLEQPLPDLWLVGSRLGAPYRSLLAVARLDGDPLGLAVVSVEPHGRVRCDQLALELGRQLAIEPDRELACDLGGAGTRSRSVSVVVTTCQEPSVLRRCLWSILGSDYDEFEVIVVENRPGPPDTRAMLAAEFADDRRVRYAEEPIRGLASARNTGLALARGELVAFTDDDVVVDRCWIRRAAEAFDRGGDVACVTGLILPLELETESQLLLDQFMTLGKGFSRRSFRLPEALSAYPLLPYTPGMIGSGANTVLRADVADRLGGFDMSLGTGTPAIGGEDLDLYIRLLQEGCTVAYEPSAIVWHAHPESRANARRQVYRYGVGLTATLTKQLIAGPDRRGLLRAVPAGFGYMRDATSRKNAGKPAGYPRRLDWLERVGMLVGPGAYLASVVRPDGRRATSGASDLTGVDGVLDTERLVLPSGQAVPIVQFRSERTRAARLDVERPRRARAPSPDRAVLTALSVLSLCLYASGRLAHLPNLALGGALGLLFFGVGTAPLQFTRKPDLATRLGVAVMVGIASVLLISAVMVLAPLWHPERAALVLLAATCAAHAIALPSTLGDVHLARARRPRPPPLNFARIVPSFACTLVGTSLWLGSAIVTGHRLPGIGGFPAQITPAWYAGVALVLAGIALGLREQRERYVAVAVGSLILASTLTPALVYGMPRAQSAAKHVEFVRAILGSHHLRADDGIYSAYSGFFAAVAWLCSLARVSDPIRVATFWPVVIGFLRLAELRFLFGRVIHGHQRRWAAITLVVLVDAFGADYFSPQSVGYVMGLGVVALAIRGKPVLDERLVVALLVMSGCALAVTHQISPYIVGTALLILGAFQCARPRWAGLAILIPAVLWAALHRGVLSGFLSLSTLGDASNFRPPQTAARPGLTRDPIVAQSSYALTLGLLVLIAAALVGLARYRRERWAWAYVTSAGAGLIFVAMNPYGNEGIFRASLFAIPWLALVAAHAIRRASPYFGAIAWLALGLGLLGTFLVAAFGMDGTAVMRRADLQAVRIFEHEAPPRSYLLEVGFGDLPSGPPDAPASNKQLDFRDIGYAAPRLPERPRARDLVTLSRRYRKHARQETGPETGQLYAVWSPVSALYAREYALQTIRQAAAWRDLLLASRSWRLVYRSDGTYLFRMAPASRGGRAAP